MPDLDEWVVRDVVFQHGGLYNGYEWAMSVICNPFGLYYARCEFVGQTEFVGMYSSAEEARQAGFWKVSRMMEG